MIRAARYDRPKFISRTIVRRIDHQFYSMQHLYAVARLGTGGNLMILLAASDTFHITRVERSMSARPIEPRRRTTLISSGRRLTQLPL